MTPKDLKVFDICKLRNGKYAMVFPNDNDKIYGLGLFVVSEIGCIGYLRNYTNDFINNMDNNKYSCYDIMKIYRSNSEYSNTRRFFEDVLDKNETLNGKVIWSRKKKLTVTEISKLLGYEVEIVAEKTE